MLFQLSNREVKFSSFPYGHHWAMPADMLPMLLQHVYNSQQGYIDLSLQILNAVHRPTACMAASQLTLCGFQYLHISICHPRKISLHLARSLKEFSCYLILPDGNNIPLDGLVQDWSISNAMEILQSCTKPSILCIVCIKHWMCIQYGSVITRSIFSKFPTKYTP